MEHLPLLLDSGLILLLLFVAGYFSLRYKIPGVIFYILAGIAVGGFLAESEMLHFAGEIGIVLLFYLLGMEFPLDRIGGIAKRVWSGGLLDVFLNLGVTIGIALLLGLDFTSAFLIGGVVYTTSSSITAKLLESTKRMANTESEYLLALLIFEDLIAPILVAILVGLTSGTSLTGFALVLLFLKIVGLTIGAILLGRFGFKYLGDFVDRHLDKDIFILFVIGISLSYAGLAIWLGLSEILGAFLAGMVMAEVKRTEQLEQVVLPIRDLLLPLFFLYFGTTISFGEGVPMIGILLIVLLWSIIAKVAVGVLGGRWFGLGKRVAFRAGLMLTARGEFSVIIVGLAIGELKIFGGIYILLSAMLGIILFIFAPQLTTLVYGKPAKKPKVKAPLYHMIEDSPAVPQKKE